MINSIWPTFVYVYSDPYFWPAMALTVICGLYISASLFDGDWPLIKKVMIALISLSVLILFTNVPRIIANNATSPNPIRPLASAATTVFVTFFYLLGMIVGARIVKHAHGGKIS